MHYLIKIDVLEEATKSPAYKKALCIINTHHTIEERKIELLRHFTERLNLYRSKGIGTLKINSKSEIVLQYNIARGIFNRADYIIIGKTDGLKFIEL